MHVRVFLSQYRRYLPCPDCAGARLKAEARLFRIAARTLPEVEALPIVEAEAFFHAWSAASGDTATELLLREIRGRLRFLLDVGLGYLTLARQSRTLSGGEAQRVTLATALGSSLTSTLYVLDEPSVGLHQRDVGRLAGVLRRLAAAGNAVVVVEHDPALIGAAAHIIDLGPGPGREGGEVVYQGPLGGLLREPRSKTGAHLMGHLAMPAPAARRRPEPVRRLRVVRARENNLRELTLDIPLGLLVCVTGVSGSGKSTLVDQVLYRNLRRQFGQSEAEPGLCEAIEGAEQLAGVVLVDQSPPGRSSRMNAATYMGVLGPLRDAFAASEDARIRGLDASAFSFNSAAGACPHCRGAGYEKLELQFLPDAYVRCPGCDGRRFRPEVLEVRCRGLNIAELLDLPARDVAELFADRARISAALQPLLDIGLGYLALSQPAPTLSGGEAQRLKLARQLARAQGTSNLLLILDEPTTGLHAADVSALLGALQKLVEGGHSVVVVEHNMDVAKAADWLVDLGPEGGDEGGRLVGEGPPEALARLEDADRPGLAPGVRTPRRSAAAAGPRRSGGASRARRGMVPFTSSAPASTIFARSRSRFRAIAWSRSPGSAVPASRRLPSTSSMPKGQRRFLDCLPAYARQFIRPLARPEVDRVESVPPTVSLEQKLSRGSSMSTVGTGSEVYHYLRLLFAAQGIAHCLRCGVPGEAADPAAARRADRPDFAGASLTLLAPADPPAQGHPSRGDRDRGEARHRAGADRWRRPRCGHPAAPRPLPGPRRRRGGRRSIGDGRRTGRRGSRSAVERALEIGAGMVIAAAPGLADRFYSTRRACPSCGAGLPLPDPRLFAWSQKFGACPVCHGAGTRVSGQGDDESREPCPACAGTRLRPEALAVRIDGRNIGEVAALTVREADAWLAGVGGVLAEVRERRAARAREPPRAARAARPRLPRPRPERRYALDRRGAAHPDRRPARIQSAGRLLRPGRADGGAAFARLRSTRAGAVRPARARQHRRRGRA